MRDFPGPLVETLPSNTGLQVGSVPHQQTRVPHAGSVCMLSLSVVSNSLQPHGL